MDSLRLCFIDIYATSDDFEYLYGKDLSELEEIINKEFSAFSATHIKHFQFWLCQGLRFSLLRCRK